MPDSRAFRLLSLEGHQVATPKAEELEDTLEDTKADGQRAAVGWGLTGA
jgi:hypothetical protein